MNEKNAIYEVCLHFFGEIDAACTSPDTSKPTIYGGPVDLLESLRWRLVDAMIEEGIFDRDTLPEGIKQARFYCTCSPPYDAPSSPTYIPHVMDSAGVNHERKCPWLAKDKENNDGKTTLV